MAVLIPSQTVLSSVLQNLVAQLVKRNNQYQSAVYSQMPVTLFCDAEGWYCKDFWLSAPPTGSVSAGGNTWFPPPGGVKASAVLFPNTTASQCSTIAGTLLTTIKAKVGPIFIVSDQSGQ